MPDSPLRLKLITCEVFHREMESALARTPNQVDVEFLSMGLHDLSAGGMLEQVQGVLDRVDASLYDAVIFGYGLCNGLRGLTARAVPFVLPRAHDCITLFLGSRQRYAEYFRDHPGTYFKTSGWIERRHAAKDSSQLSMGPGADLDAQYEEFVAKYGEDNARFLIEEMKKATRHYTQLAFVEMGVEPDDRFERQTAAEASERNLGFRKVCGDMSLIERLVGGDWGSEDFLVVQPGQRVAASYDDGVVRAEEAG